MFDDRVEISSLGTLLSEWFIDAYLNGQITLFRNPIIENILFRLHDIEKIGTDIKRINEAYENCLLKPEFNVFSHAILVVLPLVNGFIHLSEGENKIVNHLYKY